MYKCFGAIFEKKNTPINTETDWYRKLRDTYCNTIVAREYQVNLDLFEKVVLCTPNSKTWEKPDNRILDQKVNSVASRLNRTLQ